MSVLAVLLVALSTLVANTVAVDQYLILEVEKSQSVSEREMLDKLSNIEIKYKFKTAGTSKYTLVLPAFDENMNKLDSVTLPGEVTATPAENLAQVMDGLSINWPSRPLTDSNVALFKSEFFLTDQTSKQYNASLKSYGHHMKQVLQSGITYEAYSSSGALPPKHFFFANVERENVDQAAQEGVDIWGGPGEVNTKVHYMVKVQ